MRGARSLAALPDFETVQLPATPDVVAPDGSDARLLPQLAGGSLAHFTLAPGVTSRAVAHRTVEEIWFVLGGSGEMWRASGDRDEVVAMAPGVALTIPLGTRFQFRATGREPLTAVAVTMPPWPGPDEAVAVDGPWTPTA
jgi:mannose-6-phosphate isomerase-like protein (cupin superfamily)